MIEMRDYQLKLVDDVRQALGEGHRRILISAPTGAGKTRVMLSIVESAFLRSGMRSGILAERVTLVNQWRKDARKLGLDLGIRQAENRRDGQHGDVWSEQTCESRDEWPETPLVFLDECHIARREVTGWIRSLPEDVIVIGATATPMVAGLGDTYTKMVQAPTTAELTAAGWLLPLRVFAAQTRIDTSQMEIGAGNEFTGQSIDDGVRVVVGDVAGEWARTVEGKLGMTEPPTTVVFSATIASGKMLVEAFNALGLGEIAQQISCYDSPREREEALERFESGERPVLVNVSVIGRGFDAPQASVLIDASPFRASIAAYEQMVGRVLRPANGRAAEGEEAYLFDHCGNFERFYDRHVRFTRDGVDRLLPDKPDAESSEASRWIFVWKCYGCGALNPVRVKVCGDDDGVKGCGKDRPKHVKKERAWRCGVCRTIVDALQPTCTKQGCDGRKPASTENEDEPRPWKCKECGAYNDTQDVQCSACGADRPQQYEELEGELREFEEEIAGAEPVGVYEGGTKDPKYAWAHLCELALRAKLKQRKNVTAKVRDDAKKLAMARYMSAYGCWPNFEFHPVREPDVDPNIQKWWDTEIEKWKAAQPWASGPRRFTPAAKAKVTHVPRRTR